MRQALRRSLMAALFVASPIAPARSQEAGGPAPSTRRESDDVSKMLEGLAITPIPDAKPVEGLVKLPDDAEPPPPSPARAPAPGEGTR